MDFTESTADRANPACPDHPELRDPPVSKDHMEKPEITAKLLKLMAHEDRLVHPVVKARRAFPVAKVNQAARNPDPKDRQAMKADTDVPERRVPEDHLVHPDRRDRKEIAFTVLHHALHQVIKPEIKIIKAHSTLYKMLLMMYLFIKSGKVKTILLLCQC